jgi:hypothetical protein
MWSFHNKLNDLIIDYQLYLIVYQGRDLDNSYML